MSPSFAIRPLGLADLDALSHLIVEVVAHGGSISFMHPLPLAQAEEPTGVGRCRRRNAVSGWSSAPSMTAA
ncbi:hypothetical protein PQU92_12545 [Asticcacaulis sp. BYS171W]|uniref:Acetyltransferase n=1 Tax=Asticcacaulis aquaticus TaxID=2984212 RepID=A0ABT5HXF0_9CAUL|nr:hypothetical protein [Asticcacaulis aquaticus]MDC7684111.1 hypothetical protein [Asticcacaulis aquaticus]